MGNLNLEFFVYRLCSIGTFFSSPFTLSYSFLHFYCSLRIIVSSFLDDTFVFSGTSIATFHQKLNKFMMFCLIAYIYKTYFNYPCILVMRFIHEPPKRIFGAALSQAMTQINWLVEGLIDWTASERKIQSDNSHLSLKLLEYNMTWIIRVRNWSKYVNNILK